MARTITPAGHQGIWLAGVAYLVASSPTFQSLVGAASAAAALAHVATIGDDSEATGSTRPRAIVYPAEGFSLSVVALNEFRPRFATDVSFEIPPAAAVEAETPAEDRWWDEALAFCNSVDAIFADIAALTGTGTGYVAGQSHVKLEEIMLVEGPVAVEEVRAEGEQGEVAAYFLAAVYRFTGVG